MTAKTWPERREFCDRMMMSVNSVSTTRPGAHDALAVCWGMLATDPANPKDDLHHMIRFIRYEACKWSERAALEVSVDEFEAVFKGVEHWSHVFHGLFANAVNDGFARPDRAFAVENVDYSFSADEAAAAIEAGVKRMTGLDRIRESVSKAAPPVVVRDSDFDLPADPGLIVLPSTREKMPGLYSRLASTRIPYRLAPDVADARAKLLAEFPHAAVAIAALFQGLRTDAPVALRPTMLIGEPGSGKSRLARRFCELMQLPMAKFDASGNADTTFSGTPKQWASTIPCFPFRSINRLGVCNPCVLIEEVDKAGGHAAGNGSLLDGLTAFLETENSSAFPDPSLDVEIDLSAVCYLLTANDAERIPEPILDRVRIIRFGRPELAHLPALARTIMADMARVDGDFVIPLDGDELAVVGRAWKSTDMSLRKLKAILRATLTAREACAMRH